MSLDGQAWIVADARIDARKELVRELAARGCDCSTARPDAELILHAYAVWGEACVEHLLGDFAFAILDARERKLFCARDHFGVRPFFYAHVKGTFVFSNAIDVPRLHPDVPDDLHEQAIADYLVSGASFDLERTVREAVRRLAPAHVLIVSNGEVRTRRYWTLPVDPPTVFRRSRDYVDRFLELFEQAVTDRLRTDRAAVLMSGGMDSCSVAAMAKRVADKGGVRCSISAHTQTYHRLVPSEEGHFASLAARKIGIPLKEFPLDDRQLFGYRDLPEFRRPDPSRTPQFDWALADVLGRPLPARVVLTGLSGDAIFSSLRSRHCRDRIRQGRWLLLAREVGSYLFSEGRFRRLQLRGHLRGRFYDDIPARPFPEWLNPDFERRMNLRERCASHEVTPAWNEAPARAPRPEAHALMSSPVWPCLFEEYVPDNVGGCIEARHPFFDLRLVRYALSLPALPWCADKELLRRSMRGLLPDEVRLRSKQPVTTDLLMAHYRNDPKSWLENFEPVKELRRYVDVERAIEHLKDPVQWGLDVQLRPVCLNYWLKWESQYAYKMPKEECRAQSR
jgi:asparagine synthase (glutamine-hydrolysing)